MVTAKEWSRIAIRRDSSAVPVRASGWTVRNVPSAFKVVDTIPPAWSSDSPACAGDSGAIKEKTSAAGNTAAVIARRRNDLMYPPELRCTKMLFSGRGATAAIARAAVPSASGSGSARRPVPCDSPW
ncbi:hypothetical protein GCM10027184_37820 [Saccharothrix stipae]